MGGVHTSFINKLPYLTSKPTFSRHLDYFSLQPLRFVILEMECGDTYCPNKTFLLKIISPPSAIFIPLLLS